MKKISLILLLALVLSLFSGCGQDTTVTETINFDDGSYMVISIRANGSTYTTAEDVQEALMQTGSVSSYTHSPQIAPMGTSNHTYEIIALDSSKSAIAGNIPESNDAKSYFWLGPGVIRVFKPTKYMTWVEVEDGERVPVWHDIHGNILYRTEFATKNCSYYSADGRQLWTMTITGMFKENALEQYCDIVSSSITVWETDSWYVIAENTETQDSCVGYTVRFGRKNLGVTVAESSYTITISRDKAGNFY